MLSSKPWRRAAFAGALLVSTALTGLTAQAQPGPVNPPATEPNQAVLPDFTALVSRVKPAVVSITTTLGAQAQVLQPEVARSRLELALESAPGASRPSAN